ncbi:VTC domain-containing protein [Myxococcota bacterium]
MIKRFNRYELKYFVDARRYQSLVQDLSYFMVPDAHGDTDGFYRIVSLYYDSPDLSAYWSKLDGLKFRRKLRVRIYVYPGQDIRKVNTAFVEIKQRIDRTVQKRRLVLPLEEATRLCAGDEIPSGLDAMDAATASEVAYMVRAQRLRPKCIVSYRRRAFMGGRYEGGMRLTFDMKLQGRVHALKVNEVARNVFFFPLDWALMEVKVNERIPRWMVALLGKHECRLQRMSKYCAALATGMGRLKWASLNRENLYG